MEETSAGGLVVDPHDGVPCAVLIAKRNRTGDLLWTLPKGHLETGESAEDAALREITEETGINGSVVRPLGRVDYRFVHENRLIHKTVHHFLVLATGGTLSTDDIEVDDVAWVPLANVPARLTYQNERDLVTGDADLMAGLT